MCFLAVVCCDGVLSWCVARRGGCVVCGGAGVVTVAVCFCGKLSGLWLVLLVCVRMWLVLVICCRHGVVRDGNVLWCAECVLCAVAG